MRDVAQMDDPMIKTVRDKLRKLALLTLLSTLLLAGCDSQSAVDKCTDEAAHLKGERYWNAVSECEDGLSSNQ